MASKKAGRAPRAEDDDEPRATGGERSDLIKSGKADQIQEEIKETQGVLLKTMYEDVRSVFILFDRLRLHASKCTPTRSLYSPVFPYCC